MKGIKGMLAMAVAVVATAIWADVGTRLENGFSWSDSGDVVPGEWTSQYQKAMDLAKEKHIPIAAFVGRVNCTYCSQLETGKKTSGLLVTRGVNDPEFAAILKKRGYILLVGIDGYTTDTAKTLKLCQTGVSLPFCGIYWPKEDGTVFQKKFNGRMGLMPSKEGSSPGEQFVNSLYMYLKDYVSYNGGKFSAPDEEFNRMECEDETGTVNVEMVRDEFSSAAANTVKITYPNGKTKSESISWAAGEKDKVLPVDVSPEPAGFTADGQKVELKILDENGEEMSATHITYVKKAVSAGNPKWMTESFTFGEWTMNLDEAEKLVKKTEGAYTLALVQGSLWCPDCGNVEKNFLAKKDKDGNNAFEKWAKDNKIALVAIDIPNFKSADIAAESPCLLKKDAYETAPSGEKMMHSGLDYLTRKGVSDTDAADVLRRNHDLVTRNTDAGGFHRPEDKNDFRTGVPVFVLLDGDGNVRARLTRLATKSPTAELDDATFNAYLQRFNEMLKIADSWKTEIENNHPSASNPLTLAANGGSEDASLCHADMVDCFRLDGISGNAIEEVTVTGPSAATLIVEFCSLAKDGTVTSLANNPGKLSDGISLSYEFRETGDYFVRVSTPDKDKGKDDTLSDDFKLENAEQKFTSYTVTGTTVFVPQQVKAEVTTAALPESKTVSMKLTEGETYRITNFGSCDKLTKSGPDLYVASETCTAEVKVNGPFSYQIWKPGVIGFRDSAGTMVKSYCSIVDDNWKIPVQRAEGVSGSARIKVSVVGELTTLDSAAFVLKTPEITLEEGNASTNVAIYVYDSPQFTYNQTIALKLELDNKDEMPGCDIAADGAQHVLLVIEMDTKAPGRAMFSRTEPGYAKAKTVYLREGDVCALYAARIEDAQGQQHVTIKSSMADVRFDTDDWRDFGFATREEAAAQKAALGFLTTPVDFYWSDYEINEKPIYVSGVKAGKTAKITMTAYNKKGTKSKDQFKVVSASNAVSIVGIAADAPYFTSGVQPTEKAYRYVAYAKSYPVIGTTGGAVTFTKVSGSLPSGLKVSWDEASKCLVVSGIPTVAAKYGKDFTAVYQVVEKRNGKKVPGLTTQLSYTVVDPVYADKKEGSPKAINPACVKSRMISDIMVFNSDATTGWLAGTLKLTLPPTGKASGKFTCALGTVSLSGKNWSVLQEDGTLRCALAGTGKFKGFSVDVWARKDGTVDVGLTDGEEGDYVTTSVPPVLWSATHTAEDCKGYYTVSLPVRTAFGGGLDITGPGAEHASRGSAYLALTMTSASQFKSGTMKWAGVLPNGTAVSGSSTLTEEQRANKNCVYLPFVKFAKKDLFSGVVQIARGASAMDEEECHETVSHPEIDLGAGIGERPIYTTWNHTENSNKTDLGDYAVRFDAFGGIFDKNLDLNCCCTEGRGTDVMTLTVDMPKVASDYYGVLGPVTPIDVKIEANKIVRLDSTGGPQKITLSYAKATGLVSGTFKLPYDANGVTKTLSASYKGIVLLGFGNSCGCQESSQPFVSGAWTFSDKIVYGEGKLLSVKRGDKVTIDVPKK